MPASAYSETIGSFSCPSNVQGDSCNIVYTATYDKNDSNQNASPIHIELTAEEPEHYHSKYNIYWRLELKTNRSIEDKDRDTMYTKDGPVYNVTTRPITIDGISGAITNRSEFSSVDDALRYEKVRNFSILNDFSSEEITRDWMAQPYWFKGLPAELCAYYDLSKRGNGASGWVQIYGASPTDVMRAVKTIHVTETKTYTHTTYTQEPVYAPVPHSTSTSTAM